ncbi:hypothetical protein ASF60_21485 [Methylobacterium sp. Leaf113]|uniref:hypothetical protein n=1 Tax=Methylobacterium sp. Leaf113 TaxID=1736259 RepID=UPI0006FC3094|nr:hypothetical protein [Methylobacterium sp. Leaf113]KQP85973.1 hypothetical protein ASF60_21485 [Methylobacterium sp. Leaf113]
MSRVSLVVVLVTAGLVGACKPTASAPPAAAVAAAPVVAAPLPQGSGCGPAIARTQAVVDSDVATGNLNAPVGERFSTDLRNAATACQGGRDREALGLLAAAKARYGYP